MRSLTISNTDYLNFLIYTNEIFTIPSWVKGSIFYQIFVDRFYNGDQENDPINVHKWGNRPDSNNFFGGDLQGIIDKLDYLERLGINAIYLNPIFHSNSNHKYNVIDYSIVDKHFGNDEKSLN